MVDGRDIGGPRWGPQRLLPQHSFKEGGVANICRWRRAEKRACLPLSNQPQARHRKQNSDAIRNREMLFEIEEAKGDQ